MAARRNQLDRLEVFNEEGKTIGFVDPKAVAALNEDIDGAYRSFNDANVQQLSADKIRHSDQKDFLLQNGVETPVPHNLGVVPKMYTVNLKGEAMWYESSRADKNFVYLFASAEVTADIRFLR